MRTRPLNAVPAVHADPRSLFKVLVVYEDFSAGRRANETCSFLMTQLGGEFELRSELWKFEILRNQKLAEIAAAEAVEADVIIVAMHGESPLPAEVTGWIDQWLPLRGENTGALIALMGSGMNQGHSPPPAYSYLQKVAAKANMDFLPQVLALSGRDTSSFYPSLTSEGSSECWEGLLHRPRPERHWGINE